MAGDERLVEIEAVARIIEKWCKRDMPTAYDCATEILDRVRDVRGDDEAFLRHQLDDANAAARHFAQEGDRREAALVARSPQGEDHEALRGGIAQALHDNDCPAEHRLSEHPNHAAQYEDHADAVMAYLSRVSPSPEQRFADLERQREEGHAEVQAKVDEARAALHPERDTEKLVEALRTIVERATYGYQDLNSGGVLATCKRVAHDALAEFTDTPKENA